MNFPMPQHPVLRKEVRREIEPGLWLAWDAVLHPADAKRIDDFARDFVDAAMSSLRGEG